jgi:transposase
MPGKTKNYTDDFKVQIVNLRKSGKTVSSISEEYGIAKSTINKWVADFKNSGSFKAKDNRSEEENELIRLRKENKQLLMENDILKQAALIMGRK